MGRKKIGRQVPTHLSELTIAKIDELRDEETSRSCWLRVAAKEKIARDSK